VLLVQAAEPVESWLYHITVKCLLASVTFFARCSQNHDITIFDKSDAFSIFYNGLWPGSKSKLDISGSSDCPSSLYQNSVVRDDVDVSVYQSRSEDVWSK